MAFEVIQKKSGLDKLEQVVDIGKKVVDTVVAAKTGFSNASATLQNAKTARDRLNFDIETQTKQFQEKQEEGQILHGQNVEQMFSRAASSGNPKEWFKLNGSTFMKSLSKSGSPATFDEYVSSAVLKGDTIGNALTDINETRKVFESNPSSFNVDAVARIRKNYESVINNTEGGVRTHYAKELAEFNDSAQ